MTGAIASRLGLTERHRPPAPRWERVVAGPLAGRELLLAREANGVWNDMIDGRFDAELYSALSALTLRTPVIWDVGGHIGYHALGFAAHQRAARVVSFEPNPPISRVCAPISTGTPISRRGSTSCRWRWPIARAN